MDGDEKKTQNTAGSEGAKIVWPATDPDETAVYDMMDVPNPEFMQTFGLRKDVVKAREEVRLMLHLQQLSHQSKNIGWETKNEHEISRKI